MDKRQIQKTGGSSFFITLPKDWITRNKLKNKDELEIYQVQNNDLIIRKFNSKINTTSLCVDELNEKHLLRHILACYVSGYDEIILKTKTSFTPEKRRVLTDINGLIFGFEIFNDKPNTILLKNIFTNNISVKEHLNKLIKNITFMFSDLLKVTDNFDISLAQDIISRDEEIDKTNFLIMRQSTKEIKNLGTQESPQYRLLDSICNEIRSTKLERIADHIVKIAKLIIELNSHAKTFFTEKEVSLLKDCELYIDLCNKLIISNDTKIANKIIDTKSKSKTFTDITKDELTSLTPTNFLVRNSVNRIKSYIVNIAEDTINFSPKD